MRKLCLILICLLFLSGCTPNLKGGTVMYGTVVAMKYSDITTSDMDRDTYYIRVESIPDSPCHRTFIVSVPAYIFNRLTFGSVLKMTYTGFGDDWVIGWPK